MGMKIQAINTGDGLSIEVGKTYYIEDNGYDITGSFPVTALEVMAAPTASGIEVRAEIEIENPITESLKYYDISIDGIIEEAS
jgi:hypothetical protein